MICVAHMEAWKLLAAFILLIALVYSARGISFTVDRENWLPNDWQEEPMLEQQANQEESLMKRSNARQFYGLMGKRSGHKGTVFVGLMGRRDGVSEGALKRLIPEVDTSSAADMVDESNQHLDLPVDKEWEERQYY